MENTFLVHSESWFKTYKPRLKRVESYWKSKAMDSIDLSDIITTSERKHLIDTLSKNNEILSSQAPGLCSMQNSTFFKILLVAD